MVAGVRLLPKSPCINVCAMDTDTGWCLGCGRTLGEIAEWPKATPDRLADIRSALPGRVDRLKAAGKR